MKKKSRGGIYLLDHKIYFPTEREIFPMEEMK